ncbi:GNAT family N-acetyltransferase [soil metagenome]
MIGRLELALPGERFESSYREALGEQGNPLADSFLALLQRFADRRAGRVAPGMVADTTLWLVDGDSYLGRISIRHTLDDRLRIIGGHIGYDIRPSRRGQGLGSQMLALALPHAHALGIDPAMLTCDLANVASWRMIERNGGMREAAFEHEGVTRLRYWIPTT